MKYHDFNLESYEVTDRGKNITLHLMYEYQGAQTETSTINFTDVALYNFTHTMGAIITDIDEVELATLVNNHYLEITKWNTKYGINQWDSSVDNFINNLESKKYKAWEIQSAIGFYGYVIAKEVSNA